MVFIHGKMHVEGVSENSRRNGCKRPSNIIVMYGCKRRTVSSEKLCCPRKTHCHVYHIDFGLCNRVGIDLGFVAH